MLNLKALAGAAVLSATMFASGAVFTSSAHAQILPQQRPYYATRGERGSARNLLNERRKLESVIDGLQRDRHDYGGHRVDAINLLQQARVQLQAAIDYDASHPGQ